MGEKWFPKKIKQSSDLLSKPTHLLIQILASLSSAHRLAFYTHTLDLWKVLEAWNNPPQAAQPEQDGIIQSHNSPTLAQVRISYSHLVTMATQPMCAA